jgi:HEAT repeat protein
MQFELIDEIIEKIYAGNFKQRLKALHDLSYFNSEKAFSAIMKSLTDDEAKIRTLAARSLKKYYQHYQRTITEELIKLLHDSDNETALSAAEALSEAADPKTVESLLKLIYGGDEKLKIYAIIACKKIKDDNIKEALVKLIKESGEGKTDNKQILSAAINALSENISPDLLPLIIKKGIQDADARVRASSIEAISNLNMDKNVIIELLRPMLSENNARIVANACAALHKAGDDTIFEDIDRLLKHENKWVRASGCYVLGRIGSDNAIKLLLKYKTDGEPEVRINAARSIFNFKTEKAAAALIEMTADEDNKVKSEVFRLILKLNENYAFWPVIDLLKSGNKTLTIMAASVLCNIGDDAGIAVLKETLDKISDGAYKKEFNKYYLILSEICDKKKRNARNMSTYKENAEGEKDFNAGVNSPEDGIAIPLELLLQPGEEKNFAHIIIEKLFHKSQFLREEAALELSYINSKKAVFALSRGLCDPVPKVRSICARSISRHCLDYPELLPDIKDKLIELLYDDYSEAAQNAAAALGYIRDKAAVPALLEILSHENPNTRLYAAMALGRMADKTVSGHLIELLKKDDNKKVRATVITSLGFIGEAEFYDIIVKYGFEDKDPHVRASAIEALAKLKIAPGKISGVIKKALEDINNRVIANACIALWKIDDLSAMTYVTKLVKNPDKWYRASASYVLGQIASVEAVNILLSLKNDAEADVRLNAARALGNIKSPKAITALVEMLDDSDEVVKNTAYDAIIKCNDKFAFWPMAQYLKSKYEILRFMATVVLCNIGDLACVPLILETAAMERNNEVKTEIIKYLKLLVHNRPVESFKEVFDKKYGNQPAAEEGLKLIENIDVTREIKIKLYTAAAESQFKKVAEAAIASLNSLSDPPAA